MVLRAVKLAIQAALLLQVVQYSVSVNGLEANNNFDFTELSAEDNTNTVSSDPADQNTGEERGILDLNSESEPRAAEDEFALTTPLPGLRRPSTSSFLSRFGSFIDDMKDGDDSAEEDSSTTGAGSSETKPTAKKTKKPAAAVDSASAAGVSEAALLDLLGGGSGSGDDALSDLLSGSDEAKPKKPTTKKTKKPAAAAGSTSAAGISEAALMDLLGDVSGSGDDALADSLSDDLGSGDDAMADLLGGGSGSEDDDLSGLLGSLGGLGGLGGSGSGVPSFEDFMKEYGDMFSAGSGTMNLFEDPTEPQNNTVEDKDIILGPLYGGLEHGDAFSDVKNIRFGQMILNITLRGGERVDQIGLMVMTQEVVGNLVHGGEGGGAAYIEPQMGDTIESVEVHWDKHKGKTSIFYMQMVISGGKTISAGTKTANVVTLKAPKGYQFGGFHGRADGDGVFCLGGIYTKVGVTDLTVTDVMAITDKGSPDIYTYNRTIRNWISPPAIAVDTGCYQKSVDVSSNNMCPSGYRLDGDDCITQCPLDYPVDCLRECIPQNSDCTQAVIAKVVSVVSVALNIATMGVFGAFVAAYKTANYLLACAFNVANAVKSIIFYLRYKQITIPQTDTEKLMDRAFQLQIAMLDLPLAICACLGIKIPPKLMFTTTVLAVVSAVVMMAVMIGEMLFSSKNNVLMMLRESGAMNTTALNTDVLELDDFLNKKNGTCGYEMTTLTNRVIGKVQEIRGKTPGANKDDVRVEVSKSVIIMEDVPIVTNHCMGDIWKNQTADSAYKTRNLLRKTLGIIIEQLIDDGTTDMGKNVAKKESALEYANLGLFIMSVFDPTGIAWMASEFVQPICGPTEFLGEIDDGTLYDALGLSTVDEAFAGSYGIWKKKGDGSVTVYFESVDKYDVDVVIRSGGDTINEVTVPANGKMTWSATVEELQDKTFYLDRWRPGLFGLPGSGGGSLLMWVPRSSEGGHLILHARLNVS